MPQMKYTNVSLSFTHLNRKPLAFQALRPQNNEKLTQSETLTVQTV